MLAKTSEACLPTTPPCLAWLGAWELSGCWVVSTRSQMPQVQGYCWAGVPSLLCKKELMTLATCWGWFMWV